MTRPAKLGFRFARTSWIPARPTVYDAVRPISFVVHALRLALDSLRAQVGSVRSAEQQQHEEQIDHDWSPKKS